jgi:hypothetical protein
VSDDPAGKIDGAQAWSEFCDLLKKAGDTILHPPRPVELRPREGHRYPLRLLRRAPSPGERRVMYRSRAMPSW